MTKETYYFPHDYNAIQDPKMMMVLHKGGLAAIGMYWIIIEVLHQQEGGHVSKDDFIRYVQFYTQREGAGTSVPETCIKVLIESGLLIEDNGMITSSRVLKNKQFRKDISKKRSRAGKISAQKRLNPTHVEHTFEHLSTIKGKERKGKERKRKRKGVRHFVPPTQQEVLEYCLERKNGIDPNRFIDFYQANGWVQARGKPIKDWKASIRTWENNNKNKSNSTSLGAGGREL